MPWIDAPQPLRLPTWMRVLSCVTLCAAGMSYPFFTIPQGPKEIDQLRERIERLEAEIALLKASPPTDFDDDGEP
jgi:hypothetical protein